MKKVRTVLGDIDSDKLGFTYSHEHLMAVPPDSQKDRDLELSDYDSSLNELRIFKSLGGKTLVEASTIDYGRNPILVKKMSEESGIHVVMTTGFNKHIYYPDWVKDKSVEDIRDLYLSDLTKGMDGTNIKAGFIKVGSWYNMIHPLEEKTAIAAGKAFQKINAPIWIHTEVGTMGVEMLELLESSGADLTKVAVGHSDRNADPYYHLQLARKGSYIQFDGPGKVKYYPDNVRVALIKHLIDNGYLTKILISGDMGRASYLESYGGGPGFRFIKTKFVNRLLNEGISQEQIDTIFIKNPMKWLEWDC